MPELKKWINADGKVARIDPTNKATVERFERAGFKRVEEKPIPAPDAAEVEAARKKAQEEADAKAEEEKAKAEEEAKAKAEEEEAAAKAEADAKAAEEEAAAAAETEADQPSNETTKSGKKKK